MGRPSLRTQRRAELLDAFERCIERTGLAGTSLADVAEEAGVDRRLVLHNFDDRAELVRALAERMAERCLTGCAEGCAALPASGRLNALLDWLFLGDFHADRRTSVLPELLAHGMRDPALAALQKRVYVELERGLAEVFAAQRGGTPRDWRETAFSVLALSIAACDLVSVGLHAGRLRRSRDHARALVDARASELGHD